MQETELSPDSNLQRQFSQSDIQPQISQKNIRPSSPLGSTANQKLTEQAKDDDDEDNQEGEEIPSNTRQDQYCILNNEKDMKQHEIISQKALLFKGITVKIKILNHIWTENLFTAIETAKDKGIVNLIFDECHLMKGAVTRLIDFVKNTSILDSLGLHKMKFDDIQDFKKLLDAASFNPRMRTLSLQGIEFDDEIHGKSVSRCILESRTLKELDLSFVIFDDPKSFYETASGLLNERCRISTVRFRGIQFSQLEAKIMQFVLMKNKSLQILDLSQCSTDTPENLENVFSKFDQFCNLKNLIAENINADLNHFIEIFGEALGVNTKLEGLSLKENKIKQIHYCSFWELISQNRSLRNLNVTKTEVNDKVCVKLAQYLSQTDLRLIELNLSRNQIQQDGLIALSEAFKINNSVQKLNLSQNLIRDFGIDELVDALIVNQSIQELNLSQNKINNQGITSLSKFLQDNKTLKILDISKNAFSDAGFVDFAKCLTLNQGIENLNISKNKDITDEIGLQELAHSLTSNANLSVIDISGLKVRKQCLQIYFKPSLQFNIILKKIIGKIPPGVIYEDLKENKIIESEILGLFKNLDKKVDKKELKNFPIHQIDSQQTLSYLNMKDKKNDLLKPAMKLIRFKNIQLIDFTNMKMNDESMKIVSQYLGTNPGVRSLSLAHNLFSDDGMNNLIIALKTNTNLNHLNLTGLEYLTDQSMKNLEEIVTQVNMSLYFVEINEDQFDEQLIESIYKQTNMNMAIQEYLNPKIVKTDQLTEIQFDESADISEHFESAIKAWRILGPTIISVVNQNLSDDHVEKLCQFIYGRNIIKSLNLRRNKIGRAGAIAIANYIRKGDKTLTSLELERNEIDDEGGEALLRAMQTNMRMQYCKITYGNPFKQKIGLMIEREIKANLQIKASVLPIYKANNNILESYQESDRGPEFVRCALKSCELFKMLHLSLPDNMIGVKEIHDIAYVLSRNTPLKTLNLSNNIVDARAAVSIAESLENNSHLRELDLSNNRLADAGIAILLQPFILQQLQKLNNADEKQKTKKKVQPPIQPVQSQDINNSNDKNQLSKTDVIKEEEPKKLKMKLGKIFLDNNGQSNEALKHIYTVLISNKDIAISIDLSKEYQKINATAKQRSESLSERKENSESKRQYYSSNRQAEDILELNVAESEASYESSDELEESQDCQPMDNLENQDQEKSQCNIQSLCQSENKKAPLANILFPRFIKSMKSAKTFRISWQFLQIAEQKIQKSIYYFLISIIIVYFAIMIIGPFIGSSSGNGAQQGIGYCSSSLLMIQGAFAGVLAISSLIELIINLYICSILKNDPNVKTPSFNMYLISKWIQGLIVNIDTFVHVCFIASCFSCVQSGIFEYKNAGGMKNFILFLAVSAIIAVLAGNMERVLSIHFYLKAQPQVHKIFPLSFRNIQLSLISGLYSTAILFESYSLSEYMIEYGSPILAGKQKHQEGDPSLIVEWINQRLQREKLIFQDLPMIVILLCHFISTVGNSSSFMIQDTIIYLIITIVSILSSYISLAYPRENKEVDVETVYNLIQERLEQYEKKQQMRLDNNEDVFSKDENLSSNNGSFIDISEEINEKENAISKQLPQIIEENEVSRNNMNLQLNFNSKISEMNLISPKSHVIESIIGENFTSYVNN